MAQKGYQRSKVPYLIDFVENESQNRLLTAFLILFIYITVVFVLLSKEVEPSEEFTSLKMESGLGSTMQLNDFVNQTTIYPRVKLVPQQKGASLSNITVQMVISDINPDTTFLGDICNLDKRKTTAGTLQYLRMEQVCKVVLEGHVAQTDQLGRAVFKDFKIIRGPVGVYSFKYVSEKEGNNNSTVEIDSEDFTTYFDSDIASIQLYDGLPPDTYEIGKPFSVQPKIRLLDISGNPIKGKKIVAFGWAEPFLSDNNPLVSGNEFLYQAEKFSILQNAISNESNEDGVAEFSNLTIVGQTFRSTYIFFNAENKQQLIWQLPRSSILELNLIPILSYPLVQSDYAKIKIDLESTYTRRLIEGQTFPEPIKVRVVNAISGAPMSKKIIIATIVSYNDLFYPYGYRYRNHKLEILQQLVKPIPGDYSEEWDDPLIMKDSFQIRETDENGYVELKEMFFSVYGPIGQYLLKIWCDGANVKTDTIEVQTSVKEVKWYSQPPNEFLLDSQDISEFRPIIMVLDEDGKGIQGKLPIINLINSDTQLQMTQDEIGLLLNMDFQQPSDNLGIIELGFIFNFAQASEFRIQFIVTVDGIASPPSTITYFTESNQNQDTCGNVYLQELEDDKIFHQPVTYLMILNKPKQITLKVINDIGAPLPGASVALYFDKTSFVSQTPVPKKILPRFKCFTSCSIINDGVILSSPTGADGKVTISVAVIDGVETDYQVQIFAISGGKSSRRRTISVSKSQNMSQKNEVNFARRSLQDGEFDISDTPSDAQDSIGQSLNETGSQPQNVDNDENEGENLLGGSIKQSGALTYCFTNNYITMNIQTIVGEISIGNIYGETFEGQSDLYQKQIRFNLLVYDKNEDILKDYQLQLAILPLHFPGTLVPQYMKTYDPTIFVKTVIDFSQQSLSTDSVGEIVVEIYLKLTARGFFAFQFQAENIRSDFVFIKSDFDAVRISIEQQPASNIAAQTPFRAGNYMKQAIKVQVLDKVGSPLANYPVLLNLDRTTAGSEFVFIDGSDYSPEETLALGDWRVAISDKDGIAVFDKITVSVVRGKQCIKFYFVVGDLGPVYADISKNFCSSNENRKVGQCARSPSTNVYCFESILTVGLLNPESYSRLVAPNLAFEKPIQAFFGYQKLTDLEKLGNFIFSATIFEFDGIKTLQNAPFQTDMLMDGNNCFMKSNSLNKICIIEQIASNVYEKAFQVTFQNLLFKKFRGGKLRFSISDPMNYKHKNETSFTISDLVQKSLPEIKNMLGELQNTDTAIKSSEQKMIQLSNLIKTADILNSIAGAAELHQEQLQNSLQEIQSEGVQISDFKESTSGYSNTVQLFFQEVMNVINSKDSSDQTSLIVINNFPQKIRINFIPNSVYYIKDMIRVKVICYATTQSPLQNVPVQISILPSTMPLDKFGSVGMEAFLGRLAGSENPEVVINGQSNIQLDSRRTVSKTNAQGVAQFNVKILRGLSGMYQLKFESKGFKSGLSSPFFVKNKIQSVSFGNWTKPIVLESNLIDEVLVITKQNPISLNIKYDESEFFVPEQQQYPKTVELLVYKYIEPEQEKNLTNLTISVQDKIMQMKEKMENEQSDNPTNASSMMILGTIQDVVLNSGKFLLKSSRVDVDLFNSINTTDSIDKNIGDLIVTTCNISFTDYGDYQLAFTIDGVESLPSPKISIQPVSLTSEQKTTNLINFIIVIVIIIGVITLNFKVQTASKCSSIFCSLYLKLVWLIVSGLTGYQLYLVIPLIIKSKYSWTFIPITNIFTTVAYGILAITLLDMARYIFLQNPDQFSNLRANFEISYTAQLLRPSSNYPNSNQILGETSRVSDQANLIQKSMAAGTESLQQDYASFEEREKSLVSRLQMVFVPFSSASKRNFQVGIFYYPQSLIAAILISQFAIVFMAIKIFIFLNALAQSLLRLLESVEDNFVTFLSKSVMMASESPFQITQQNFNENMQIITLLFDTLEGITNGVRLGMNISLALAVLIYFLNVFGILLDFRGKIIGFRKGNYAKIDQRKIALGMACKYLPFHVSSTVIGFLLSTVIFGIILSIPCMTIVWLILWDLRMLIISIILSKLLDIIIKIVAKQIAYNGQYDIRFKNYTAVYDLVIAFLKIISGIVTAIKRFIILIVTTSFSFQTVFTTIYPFWLFQLFRGDAVTATYQTMAFNYYIHNNPIANTFVKLLMRHPENNSQAVQPKLQRIQNQFYLALMLNKIPQSQKHHFLRKSKQKSEKDDPKSDLNRSILDQHSQIELIEMKMTGGGDIVLKSPTPQDEKISKFDK